MTTRDGGSMAHEEWRDVVGYEGYYQVSNLGRVRSVDRRIIDSFGNERFYKGKPLKPSLKSTGYYSVALCKDGNKDTAAIHRLVATAFLESDSNHTYIDHIDGDRTNNKLSNLRWCTQKENLKYAAEAGSIDQSRIARAGKRYISKHKMGGHLTRVLRSDGKIYPSVREAARDLGVTASSVYKVLNGENSTCKGFSLRVIGKQSFVDATESGNTKSWYQMTKQARPVIRSDGKRFPSIRAAARAIGTNSSNIIQVAQGKRHACMGYSFRYADE
jgi:hypothetical protein